MLKYRKQFYIFCTLLLSSIYIQCNKEGTPRCFKGNGTLSSETRIPPNFSVVYIEDNMDLYLKQGPIPEIKIEAGENLIPYIKTDVVNNELRIKNENRCNWARSYKKGKIKVYVTNPNYYRIRQFGSGLISSIDTLKSDSLTISTRETGDIDVTIHTKGFYIQNMGTSNITAKGHTDLCGIFHTGEGYLYFQDLNADILWTLSDASGNEYFNAKYELIVDIHWVGDVYYKGNPKINLRNNTGTGKLMKL